MTERCPASVRTLDQLNAQPVQILDEDRPRVAKRVRPFDDGDIRSFEMGDEDVEIRDGEGDVIDDLTS